MGGGSKRTERQRGGGIRPESYPSKTWTCDPQIGDFLWNLCRIIDLLMGGPFSTMAGVP